MNFELGKINIYLPKPSCDEICIAFKKTNKQETQMNNFQNTNECFYRILYTCTRFSINCLMISLGCEMNLIQKKKDLLFVLKIELFSDRNLFIFELNFGNT